MPYSEGYGSCFWCSYQYAWKTHYYWYDGYGYYHYNDTCSCSTIMGCGSHGYHANGYCPMYQHGYPTVYISHKVNRYGYTTHVEYCSQCSYYMSYSY